MAKSAPTRLSVETPFVREYSIVDVQHVDKMGVTICKYLRRVNTKRQDENGKDIWEDKVMQEWVENPLEMPLIGKKIRVTTEIAD